MRLEGAGVALLLPDHHVASTPRDDLLSLILLSAVRTAPWLLVRAICSISFETGFGGNVGSTSMSDLSSVDVATPGSGDS